MSLRKVIRLSSWILAVIIAMVTMAMVVSDQQGQATAFAAAGVTALIVAFAARESSRRQQDLVVPLVTLRPGHDTQYEHITTPSGAQVAIPMVNPIS